MNKNKLWYSLIVLVLSISQMFASDGFTATSVSIPQGGAARLEIDLNNSEGSYGGFQFELKLPAGITATVIEKADRLLAIDGYVLQMNQSDTENNIYSVLGYNTGRINIAGSSGAVVYITLMASSEQEVGTVLNGKLQGVTISTIDADNIDAQDAEFVISIGEPSDSRTLLDENSTTVPEAATGVNVRVKRTIKAGNWSTICLPFAMTNAQMREAFGDDVELADFNGYVAEEDDGGDIVGITVNFVELDTPAMEANHPYIIKVSSPVTEFTVDGVDIDPEEEPTVATKKRTKKQWSEMIGTYVANTTLEATMLFLNGNKFYYSAGLTQMKGYRAYFDFYDVLTDVENTYAVKMAINIDDIFTGLEDIEMDKAAEAWYDLSGRRVSNRSGISPLSKGIYIVNGKKKAVK